mmetsp:Transcript_36830/g.90972  ORF Transcript_36830/g.90972 Transcript_36830/m.90972 type:complete len:82 (+) Transcript_36830:326-571(+)
MELTSDASGCSEEAWAWAWGARAGAAPSEAAWACAWEGRGGLSEAAAAPAAAASKQKTNQGSTCHLKQTHGHHGARQEGDA